MEQASGKGEGVRGWGDRSTGQKHVWGGGWGQEGSVQTVSTQGTIAIKLARDKRTQPDPSHGEPLRIRRGDSWRPARLRGHDGCDPPPPLSLSLAISKAGPLSLRKAYTIVT